jgi:hypothetical protein
MLWAAAAAAVCCYRCCLLSAAAAPRLGARPQQTNVVWLESSQAYCRHIGLGDAQAKKRGVKFGTAAWKAWFKETVQEVMQEIDEQDAVGR